ncbi:hypothetical protein L208DRAFT_1323170, partial [Tricholoma matsutake]
LLHIADGIEDIGPSWTCWAFPMEHFCGYLQPAIKSRCFPYPSIDAWVTVNAQLSHVKVIYDLEDELSLQPPKTARLEFSDLSCALFGLLFQCWYLVNVTMKDPSCVLLPP